MSANKPLDHNAGSGKISKYTNFRFPASRMTCRRSDFTLAKGTGR